MEPQKLEASDLKAQILNGYDVFELWRLGFDGSHSVSKLREADLCTAAVFVSLGTSQEVASKLGFVYRCWVFK